MNKLSLCACFLLGIGGLSTDALAAPSTAFAGQPYEVVRSKLLQLGYRPVKFVHQANPCPDGQTFCGKFPEVISCSGTGLAVCEFAWTRKGKYFAVVTTGELTPYLSTMRQVGQRERQEGWNPVAHGIRKGWSPR